jgi:hypothetical protein
MIRQRPSPSSNTNTTTNYNIINHNNTKPDDDDIDSNSSSPPRMSFQQFDVEEDDSNSNEHLRIVQSKPWKLIILSLGLLLTGILSLILAISFAASGDDKLDYKAPLAIGLVAILPGAYGTFLLCGAWRGWKGFTWDALPNPT